MTKDLIAFCGLYCGACDWHVSFPKAAPGDTNSERLKNGTCPGCREEGNICGFCEMKKCATRKGIDLCGKCAEYPCGTIESFMTDGKPHHADIRNNLAEIREFGENEWAARQQRRWTCQCGIKFSWYDKNCRCGREVKGY